jgi:hypothetical protein
MRLGPALAGIAASGAPQNGAWNVVAVREEHPVATRATRATPAAGAVPLAAAYAALRPPAGFAYPRFWPQICAAT